MKPIPSSIAGLMGTASFFALTTVLVPEARAQAMAQAAPEQVPEQVLVTGSLIHGAAAVGVPVLDLSPLDFKESGALTIAEFFRTVSSIQVGLTQNASAGSGAAERGTFINVHGLGGTRAELMINGMRYPLQSDGANQIDPSVLPELAIDRIDVLTDGASATYGSDAIAGVINVIMKRGFDGATTELRFGTVASELGGGGNQWQAAQLYGRTWNGGDITVSYQNTGEDPLATTPGRLKYQATVNYTPWGLDNRTPIASSFPGIVSIGAPNVTTGTGCTNCYSIPTGQNGTGLTWATLLANPGVTNEQDPYALSSMSAYQQTNAGTMTFDQRLFPGVSFFADGFLNNRRAQYDSGSNITPGKNSEGTFSVPTTNPYYPVGAPAGLRVSYDLSREFLPQVSAGEIAKRFDGGFNLDLPFNWTGRIYGSLSENHTYLVATNLVNTNMLNAALGNTVAAMPAAGNVPPVGSFTKPSTIPYLNLFCDPTQFTCNDPATLNYISGFRIFETNSEIFEYGANFDGPLLSLPAGEVRAALGTSYTIYDYYNQDFENYNQPVTSNPANILSSIGRNVPAVYGQLNIPVFGEGFQLPLVQRLIIEASLREDWYSDLHTNVTSPKVAVDWTLGMGLTLKGDWGKSFRAPFATELLPSNSVISPVNLAASGTVNNQPTCPNGVVGGTPVPGSIGAALNPTCSAALMYLGGIQINNSIAGSAGLRPGDGISPTLAPETAINWSLGGDFAPDYIKGLDIQATYFNVNISNYIFSPSIAGGGASLINPLFTYTFITAANNKNFAQGVQLLVANPQYSGLPSLASNIAWIADGADQNTGSFKVSGIDFAASLDRDLGDDLGLGDIGSFGVGVNGTYYLKNQTQNIPGGPITDIITGNTQIPLLKYRARLTWTNGTYAVDTFVNYQSHYFTIQAFPPASFLTAFPKYSDLEPAFTTVDLSLAYNTTDKPANDYLKNITVDLLVNDIFDKRAPFSYFIQTSGANPSAVDTHFGETNVGRFISVVVTKQW